MSVLVIGGGFALWAGVHSVLASRWCKSLIYLSLGPGAKRWYRVGFVVFAVVSLTPILAAIVVLPDRMLYVAPTPWRWVMVAGQVGALVILGLSVLQAGWMHFLGIAQLSARDPSETGDLQVRDIYRYVRHPLYLFSVILIWLTPAMSQNLAGLYTGITLYFIVGSYHEEALLVHEFGAAYERYREQVPRFAPVPGHFYRDEGGAET